jgi:hypothetical protein
MRSYGLGIGQLEKNAKSTNTQIILKEIEVITHIRTALEPA